MSRYDWPNRVARVGLPARLRAISSPRGRVAVCAAQLGARQLALWLRGGAVRGNGPKSAGYPSTGSAFLAGLTGSLRKATGDARDPHRVRTMTDSPQLRAASSLSAADVVAADNATDMPGSPCIGRSIWYDGAMTTQTKPKGRRTAMVPVTTMEELPVLDDGERAELLKSLATAEADIAAGRYTEHDPNKLKDRLARIQRTNRR